MFSDTLTITIAGAGKTLNRIKQDQYSSEYLLRTSTEEYRLFIRNTTTSDRKRGVNIDVHNVELRHTVFPVAPATLSVVRISYFVVKLQQGDTLTAPVDEAAGLFGWATATSNAALTKLMNYES